jgi:hypothetical protein
MRKELGTGGKPDPRRLDALVAAAGDDRNTQRRLLSVARLADTTNGRRITTRGSP